MTRHHSFILGIVGCLAALLLVSCEKAQPYIDKVEKLLDREGESVESLAETKPKVAPEDIPPPPEPVKMEPVVNKEAQISILGYHDFTESSKVTDMKMNVNDFRDQMQAIKDAEIPVISMREFLDWKQGKKDIPEFSILITIDDGWRAVYDLALPVFKEFDFPFTVFLYQNYVGIGGRSMTFEEVRELAANKGTICSHSISHQNMARRGNRSQEQYEQWIQEELNVSHDFLMEKFGDTGAVEKTFAYPYGIYSDFVQETAKELGYEACFTVSPGKTKWDHDDTAISRYIIHGNLLKTFDPALAFRTGNVTTSGRKLLKESLDEEGEVQEAKVQVFPPKDSVIDSRLPKLEIDLSRLDGVEPDSISMRVTGFGKVPHVYDPATGIASYQMRQRLRVDSCGVQVSFRHSENRDNEIIGWNFNIDLTADYLTAEKQETRPSAASLLK
ncbi:MAG: polysaccharide deacetylase family protein [Verrucomicrobiota bacterium]